MNFRGAALVAKASGGFTQDRQAFPGHLWAFVWVAYSLDLEAAWAPAGFGGR